MRKESLRIVRGRKATARLVSPLCKTMPMTAVCNAASTCGPAPRLSWPASSCATERPARRVDAAQPGRLAQINRMSRV